MDKDNGKEQTKLRGQLTTSTFSTIEEGNSSGREQERNNPRGIREGTGLSSK